MSSMHPILNKNAGSLKNKMQTVQTLTKNKQTVN